MLGQRGWSSVPKDRPLVSLACSRLTLLVVAAALASSSRAPAELGGAFATVQTDSHRMGARMASADMGRYTRHVLTRGNGGTVHELTNAAGQVFAVTWSGPGKPDLRAVLGRYFTAFQSASGTPGRTMHALRRPAQVNRSGVQIQTGGHMGWFRGVAFVPALAPSGFVAGDLPQEP